MTAAGPVGPDARRVAAVLLDIDGTILRPGCRLQRAHMQSMADAVEWVADVRAEFHYQDDELYVRDRSLSGFTDAGTIGLILELGAVPPDEQAEVCERVVDMMTHRLATVIDDVDCRGDLLPGVAELVQNLRGGGVIVGLSTGNARAVAARKMRAAGLDGLGTLGGFGDRQRIRSNVARSAVADVQAYAAAASCVLETRDIVLIGDTPSDVRAAHEVGIRSLAVATGGVGKGLLKDAEPDVAADSLLDVRAADLVRRVARHWVEAPSEDGSTTAEDAK